MLDRLITENRPEDDENKKYSPPTLTKILPEGDVVKSQKLVCTIRARQFLTGCR